MQQSALSGIGLPVVLFVIMVGIGRTLTMDDLRREGRAPEGAVVGS